jgi:hypothetical protein
MSNRLMTEFVSEQRSHCPYCAEPISLVIDTSAGSQSYIEDCQVCCQPMQVTLNIGTDLACNVTVDRAG